MDTKTTVSCLDLVGMDLPDAKKLITKNHLMFRVIKDGVIKHPIPTPTRNDRFLLSVTSDIVVDAIIG